MDLAQEKPRVFLCARGFGLWLECEWLASTLPQAHAGIIVLIVDLQIQHRHCPRISCKTLETAHHSMMHCLDYRRGSRIVKHF